MWQKRMLVIAAFAVIFPAVSAATAFGQPSDPTIDPLDKRVKAFFESIKSKGTTAAYTELLGVGLLSTQDRKTLEDETKKIEGLYGAYRNHELVYTKRVGNDLVFLKYLYKCEKFPVLWHVTFYRTGSGSESTTDSSRAWQIVSVRFDTDLELLTLLLRDK